MKTWLRSPTPARSPEQRRAASTMFHRTRPATAAERDVARSITQRLRERLGASMSVQALEQPRAARRFAACASVVASQIEQLDETRRPARAKRGIQLSRCVAVELRSPCADVTDEHAVDRFVAHDRRGGEQSAVALRRRGELDASLLGRSSEQRTPRRACRRACGRVSGFRSTTR